MDATAALFFSLGMALTGPADTSLQPTQPVDDEASSVRIAQTQQRIQRAEKMQKRIELTNAWLKRQQHDRRAAAVAKQKPLKVASSESTCSANWLFS